jgi:hypothetical protein
MTEDKVSAATPCKIHTLVTRSETIKVVPHQNDKVTSTNSRSITHPCRTQCVISQEKDIPKAEAIAH